MRPAIGSNVGTWPKAGRVYCCVLILSLPFAVAVGDDVVAGAAVAAVADGFRDCSGCCDPDYCCRQYRAEYRWDYRTIHSHCPALR